MNTGFVRLAVATVPTVYGIETPSKYKKEKEIKESCNSTYRLRY